MRDAARQHDGLAFHIPVMVQEVVRCFSPTAGKIFVDATLGAGGHANAVLQEFSPEGCLIGIDRDATALEEARRNLEWAGERVTFRKARMGDIAQILQEQGALGVDGVLADLGVSSHQLDCGERGFSFREDAPLDMRMDRTGGETAAELLVRLSQEELADLFHTFGEERYARRIARAIAAQGEMETTGELAALVERVVPKRFGRMRIHPATRVFQALRIAVNDELGELQRFLEAAPRCLHIGGTLVMISYHSLEDRMVKHSFRAYAATGAYEVLFKKPVIASDAEVKTNPRARSAKLRALKRTSE